MIDVLVPTLWRPHYLQPFLESLYETSFGAEPTFVCQDDDLESIAEVERLACRLVTVPAPASANQKVNAGYRATSGEFFFVGSDDIRFTPGWLDAALAHMTEGVHVVGVSDGIPAHMHGGELPGHVLVRRSYIETQSGVVDQPNTVVNEGYHHYYSDIEFWQTAKMRGCFRSAFDARVTHLHPNAGIAEVDRTAALSRGFLREDMAKWAERSALLFAA